MLQIDLIFYSIVSICMSSCKISIISHAHQFFNFCFIIYSLLNIHRDLPVLNFNVCLFPCNFLCIEKGCEHNIVIVISLFQADMQRCLQGVRPTVTEATLVRLQTFSVPIKGNS